MLKNLFLGLFFICSLIHLYHSWTNDQAKRAKTKPFLLLFLILYCVTATQNLKIMLLLALIFSWLGDVLLIPKGDIWFTAGGISFLIGHLCFVQVYAPKVAFSEIPWHLLIPIITVYFTISYLIIVAVRDNTPKAMVLPMYLYLLTNSTMNTFAMMQLMSLRNKGALIAYIGAVLFFISDCLLFIVRYHKNKNRIWKKHFLVMLTYLAGEFLITLGLLIIGG